MKKIVAMAFVLALSGCATVEQMRAAPSAQLCYALASGNTGGIRQGDIYQELANRGEDCNKYSGLTNSRIQSDAQRQNQALQLIQAGAPRTAPAGGRTDLQCVNNCTAQGYMLQFCNSKCSY